MDIRRSQFRAVVSPHLQGGVSRLAEIIAGFALGLDLSTLAAIASGQFASAHEKLGRKHPTHGLKDAFLDTAFFTTVLGGRGELLSWSKFAVSIIYRYRCKPPF